MDRCESIVVEVGIQGPPGASSDMQRSVYDTNNNGIVDAAESVPWAGVIGGQAAVNSAIAAREFSLSFTDTDLSMAGLLIVDHNLGKYPTAITVWDGTRRVMTPDWIEDPTINRTILSLEGFRPLVGTWIIYLGA
jgi:hypothetical protein